MRKNGKVKLCIGIAIWSLLEQNLLNAPTSKHTHMHILIRKKGRRRQVVCCALLFIDIFYFRLCLRTFAAWNYMIGSEDKYSIRFILGFYFIFFLYVCLLFSLYLICERSIVLTLSQRIQMTVLLPIKQMTRMHPHRLQLQHRTQWIRTKMMPSIQQ